MYRRRKTGGDMPVSGKSQPHSLLTTAAASPVSITAHEAQSQASLPPPFRQRSALTEELADFLLESTHQEPVAGFMALRPSILTAVTCQTERTLELRAIF
jgi:hypothetical protein